MVTCGKRIESSGGGGRETILFQSKEKDGVNPQASRERRNILPSLALPGREEKALGEGRKKGARFFREVPVDRTRKDFSVGGEEAASFKKKRKEA